MQPAAFTKFNSKPLGMSQPDKPSRKPERVLPSIPATSPHLAGSGPAEPPTLSKRSGRRWILRPSSVRGLRGVHFLKRRKKKSRAGAALALKREVETRGVAPGSTPGLRERLQGKINVFIRPIASLQRGRHPHTHTKPPRDPVHPGVNLKFSPDKLGSDDSPRVGDLRVPERASDCCNLTHDGTSSPVTPVFATGTEGHQKMWGHPSAPF